MDFSKSTLSFSFIPSFDRKRLKFELLLCKCRFLRASRRLRMFRIFTQTSIHTDHFLFIQINSRQVVSGLIFGNSLSFWFLLKEHLLCLILNFTIVYCLLYKLMLFQSLNLTFEFCRLIQVNLEIIVFRIMTLEFDPVYVGSIFVVFDHLSERWCLRQLLPFLLH